MALEIKTYLDSDIAVFSGAQFVHTRGAFNITPFFLANTESTVFFPKEKIPCFPTTTVLCLLRATANTPSIITWTTTHDENLLLPVEIIDRCRHQHHLHVGNDLIFIDAFEAEIISVCDICSKIARVSIALSGHQSIVGGNEIGERLKEKRSQLSPNISSLERSVVW
jgi:hypothetical protein